MRLTPRELATRAYALTGFAGGWIATVLAWPAREMTRSEGVALGGCVMALAWVNRHVVRTSTARHYISLEDLVLVPLVLVYPVGWVMAVGAVSALPMFSPTRAYRGRRYASSACPKASASGIQR